MKPPPQDRTDWLMLAVVFAIATISHMLKVISRGDPLNRQTTARHVARAALTGIVAAGVWSGITEFRELNPATAVAIASGVAILGVDYLEGMLDKAIARKLGVEKDKAATPEPAPLPDLTPPPPNEPEVTDNAKPQ